MIGRAAIAATLLSLGIAGTALAASDSIHVKTPTNAKVGVAYSIAMSGHATKHEKLYMFVDYYKCGATPAVEYASHRANGDFWNVNGNFKETSRGWRSPVKAAYHACVYLVKKSAPRIPSGGILAHKFVSFRVH